MLYRYIIGIDKMQSVYERERYDSEYDSHGSVHFFSFYPLPHGHGEVSYISNFLIKKMIILVEISIVKYPPRPEFPQSAKFNDTW